MKIRMSSPPLIGLIAIYTCFAVQAASVQELSRSPLSCEVFCSTERPREGGARLILRSAGKLKFNESQLRLDWTVHKNGLATREFATFEPLRAGVRSAPRYAEQKAAATMDPEHKLEITDVQAGKDVLVITIEGLEPGLNYRWRLAPMTKSGWTKGEPLAACQAPVCPIDYVDENKLVKKR